MYFIRFSDPDFVTSIETYGYEEDKKDLTIPQGESEIIKAFILGFMRGKGSFFNETRNSKTHGFKIVYRSKKLILDLAKQISIHCEVKEAKPFCHEVKNVESCEIKYVGSECERIEHFIKSQYLSIGEEIRDFQPISTN